MNRYEWDEYEMIPLQDGDYVLYEDVKQLQAENVLLRDSLNKILIKQHLEE